MFGSDGSPIIQYVVIFAVIFTALAAIVFVVRRLTGRGLALPGRGNGRGRQPRLGIVDVYELDRARQLILLRRDNVEHLLLVGGPNDVVIERNIQRGQRPLPEAGLRPEPVSGPIAEPRPDPLVGAGRLPEPLLSLPDGAERRAEPSLAPGFAMPVVVPSPVPRSGAAPPVTLPLDAGLLAGDEPGQDIPVPRRAPAPDLSAQAPPTPRPAPAVREPFSARRILGRTTHPARDAGTGAAAGHEPGDAPPMPTPDAVPSPALPPASPASRREVDPVVLSDMARQLQAALARPASAVTPAPAASEPVPEPTTPEPPPPPSPEPPVTAPPPGVDPVAAAMAASVPAPTAAADDPHPEDAPSQMPEAAPPPPQPDPAPESVLPSPPHAEPAPIAEPDPKAAGNPFSVEEIEAEFARLLGRPLDRRG